MTDRPTPWGLSQNPTQIAPGIILHSAASHGGIELSPERMRELPVQLQKPHAGYCPFNWFEEDCEIALVILAWPDLFSPAQQTAAERTAQAYYPTQLFAYRQAQDRAKG